MSDNASGASIEVSGLTKVYGNTTKHTTKPAVNAVDLDVRPGEFMTLLGPSGSGKTTVLNMIAGFEDVTEGRILLDGQDIASRPPYKRNLGMVFQDYALFPHMTAAENVAFPLQRRKIGRKETARRVVEALEVVRLDQHGDRLPAQLSGGQQQRVALARAIVFRPRALLLDEPLGALDKRLRDSLQLEISRLHSELGITFLFVTHDQEEALALSDRIAVFRDGQIEQVGTPTELYETPASQFVATFLGDSNVFTGTVRSGILDTGTCELRCGGPDGPSTLIVRPERMTIGHNGSSESNRLTATVSDVVYQGAFRRIHVRFDSGHQGMVRDGTDAPPVAAGDRVDVGWDISHGVVVADDLTS
jgi:putative spermidine/putrescine transport system ATP-binding protein